MTKLASRVTALIKYVCMVRIIIIDCLRHGFSKVDTNQGSGCQETRQCLELPSNRHACAGHCIAHIVEIFSTRDRHLGLSSK